MPNEMLLFAAGAVALAVIGTLVNTFFTVEQRTTAIVQRLGKSSAQPGRASTSRSPSLTR